MARDSGIAGEHDKPSRSGSQPGLFACMLENASVAVSYIDTDLVYRAANEAALAASDAVADEVVDVRAERVLEDDPRVLERLKRVLATGRDFSELVAYEAPGRAGEVKYRLASYIVHRDEDGAVSGVCMQSIEVTDRSSLERPTGLAEELRASLLEQERLGQELAAERVRLQVVLDNSNAQLAYLDSGFRFVLVNDAYVHGSGHSRDELLGRNHFELFPSEENEEIFRRVRSTGQAVEFRGKPFEYPDQPWRGVTYWDWRLVPVDGDGDEVIGFVLSLIDVTDSVRRKRFSGELNRLNEEMHATTDLDAMLARVVPHLASAIGCEAVGIATRAGGGWRIVDVHGLPEDLKGRSFDDRRLPNSVKALETGDPLLLNESDGERYQQSLAKSVGMRSALFVPLMVPGRRWGVIAFGYKTGPGVFDELQVDFAKKAASSLSLAAENAHLFQSERTRRRRIEALHGVMEVAVSSLDAEESAQRILDYLVDQHGFELANVWVVSDEVLELAAQVNYPESYREGFSPMPLSAPYDATKVFHSGTPVVVPDAAEANPAVREMYAAIGVRLGAYVIVPLHSRGKTIGTLHFGWKQPRKLADEDVEFYSSLGAELGVVLENTQLFEQRSRQVEYAEALNRIDAAVHSTLDCDEIMERVVVEMTEALGVDVSAIHMRRDDHWEFAYTYGLPEELAGARLPDEEAPLSVRVLRTQEPVITNDVSSDERADVRLMERHGVTALIAVPLIVRGEALGVLFTGCRASRKTFSDEEVAFANKVALTLALALQNAQLFASEHRVATQLQEALLSLPGRIPGVEFAHAYHAASEAARVGGDFYDIFELNHDHVGMTIGDVAGKGLEAAVLTSLAKNTIRAHAAERGKTPSRILSLANDVIYRATSSESFVTLFFGILDCRDGRFVYANAGHTTAALVKADASLSKLSVTGPLLGGFGDVEFGQAEICVDLGEVLFLYTDGLSEARSPLGEFYGEERLLRFLRENGDRSANRVVEEVIHDALAFSGGRLSDDLALLAVRRLERGHDTPRQQKWEL